MNEDDTKNNKTQSKENLPSNTIHKDNKNKQIPDEKSNKTNKEKSIPAKIRESFIKTPWSTVLTGVIAFATIVYACVSTCQLRTMNRQLDISERAWVTPIGTVIINFKEGEKFSIVSTFINSGQTPALNTVIDFDYTITIPPEFSSRLKMNFNNLSQTSKLVIGPSARFQNTITTENELNKNMIDVLDDPRTILKINGLIEYDDIFERHHCTNFCFIYDSRTKSFIGCEEGNTINDGAVLDN